MRTVGTENNLYYTKLKDLQLRQLKLDVSVGGKIGTGIQSLAVRNDNSVLSSGSPLAPFGQNPHRSAGFYIANDEINRKQLKEITFHLEWIGLPNSFASASGYYMGYKNINGETIEVNNSDFQAKLKAFNNRKFLVLESSALFNLTPDDILNSISSLSYSFSSLSDNYTDMDLANTESDDPFDWIDILNWN